jgi:orotate phosphoribosyltransferase
MLGMQTLAARIRSSARISGHFVLRSGLTSNTYFDKYQFESDPALLRAIAEAMAPLVPPGTEVLAGLEMGGIPIVTMLSQITQIPAAFIRKEPKDYGTCRYAEGASLQGKRFILVEDVVSSGGAIIDAMTKLKADGMVPEIALCVIDRQSGGAEALQAAGLALKALFSFEEIDRG